MADLTDDLAFPPIVGALAGDELIPGYKTGRKKFTTQQIANLVTILSLGLGTVATLAADTDTALAANSDLKVATQKAVKAYVDAAVTGLFDFKGSTDCSANPNYPAASKGDAYVVTVAGKIGGAAGASVDVGDVYVAKADNAGGTQAAVGASWFVLEHNLAGALLSANNLSDLSSAVAARANLGLVIGTDVQAYDADLAAIAALTTTAYGRAFLALADASAARTAIGTVIGTNVQAWDADLDSIAALTTTSYGRAFLALADASAARTAIGAVIGTDVQAYNAKLAAIAGLTLAADKAIYWTGASAAAAYDLTSFGRTLAGSANAAAGRSTLGAVNVAGDTMTGNLALNGHWLSGDGGNEGLSVDSSGNVGVGTTTPISTIGRALQVYNGSSAGTVADNSLVQVTSLNRNAVVQLHGVSTGNSSLGFGDAADPTATVAQISVVISTGDMLFRSGGTTERARLTAAGDLYLNANTVKVLDQSGLFYLRQYIVATLPTVGTAGRLAAVTDALAPTYNATLVGGGAIKVPAYDNGTNWTAH